MVCEKMEIISSQTFLLHLSDEAGKFTAWRTAGRRE